ncbi:MAG: hypothetical protein ACQ9MH_07315 [Nitrospinales bacterium]
MEQVKKLIKKRDIVADKGGIWTAISQSPTLREHSTKGIQLDSKINLVLSTLHYLCETIDGVPLNDLAIYLKENLAIKSKKDFRAELIILGKNHTVIDVWWEFHETSLKNENRQLDINKIKNSISKVNPIFDKLIALQLNIEKTAAPSNIVEAESLLKNINEILSSDEMMSQAIKEDAQVPYWDIDESSGGS